jgi:hypothetical protein
MLKTNAAPTAIKTAAFGLLLVTSVKPGRHNIKKRQGLIDPAFGLLLVRVAIREAG